MTCRKEFEIIILPVMMLWMDGGESESVRYGNVDGCVFCARTFCATRDNPRLARLLKNITGAETREAAQEAIGHAVVELEKWAPKVARLLGKLGEEFLRCKRCPHRVARKRGRRTCWSGRTRS